MSMKDFIKKKPFEYLVGLEPEKDAPVSDNPSGLYCPSCRRAGINHCSEPDYCGELRPMKPKQDV